MPSQLPFKGPQIRMASIIYWEQVGVCLQLLGKRGEISHWYNLTRTIKKVENMSVMNFSIN